MANSQKRNSEVDSGWSESKLQSIVESKASASPLVPVISASRFLNSKKRSAASSLEPSPTKRSAASLSPITLKEPSPKKRRVGDASLLFHPNAEFCATQKRRQSYVK